MLLEQDTARGKGRPLRVAYFAGTLRPGHDGVTRVLYRLMECLKGTDTEAIFFSPVVPDAASQALPMFKVPSVAFPWYRDYRFALPGSAYFQRQLREFRPDLLHINSPCSLGAAAVQYGRRLRIPVVATYHTHFSSYAKYYNLKAIEPAGWNYLRGLYNRCDRTYVPSLPIIQELESRGFRNLEFLPHGVDTSTFHPRFRDEEWRNALDLAGKNVLLFVGRLVWEKDLATLLQTYQILRCGRSDWKLVLVGDGPIRGELQRGMPDARFLGYLSGKALSTAYASSDLLVFPSTTETFGNVTLEAMASGVVPVCVRAGGASGVVRDGENGYLANPRDPVDLAGRIEFLLDHPDRRMAMAESALAFARSQTWDRIFQHLFDSYRLTVRLADLRRGGAWRDAA
jgi:phosphatidylinositol alpha 1,6-mannosyltransferase